MRDAAHLRRTRRARACERLRSSVVPRKASSMLISTGTSKSWPGRWCRRPPARACRRSARTDPRNRRPRRRTDRRRRAVAPSRAAGEIPLPAAAARRVVGGALFGILQRLVGLGDFLELRFGARLLRDVRVIFLREPAIRLLDLVSGRATFDAESRVVVGVLHLSIVHSAPPSSSACIPRESRTSTPDRLFAPHFHDCSTSPSLPFS